MIRWKNEGAKEAQRRVISVCGVDQGLGFLRGADSQSTPYVRLGCGLSSSATVSMGPVCWNLEKYLNILYFPNI